MTADLPGSLAWTAARVQEVAADEAPCWQCGHRADEHYPGGCDAWPQGAPDQCECVGLNPTFDS